MFIESVWSRWRDWADRRGVTGQRWLDLAYRVLRSPALLRQEGVA